MASGLALATTLMAMQVADTMSSRPCAYRSAVINVTPVRTPDHGYLGLTYTFNSGSALVQRVLAGTPAAKIGLQKGDRVLSVDGDTVDSLDELQDLIANSGPGYKPTLAIKRGTTVKMVNPTLAPWPVSSY
ncbi:MAG: PDZ domain-containing protein [Kofleriaceae bacterium]